MKEQIEEMAKVLRHGTICYNCRSSINGNERRDWGCHRPNNLDCPHDEAVLKACEALYNAGYRKQRNGEWIWTENGEEDYEQYWVCSCCHEKSYWESKFCSDCGAKMKGGAE